MKWSKTYYNEKNIDITEYAGAIISVEQCIALFEVKLHFRNLIIFLGSFESFAEAKRYIKNGKEQIKNIVLLLEKINIEIADFNLEPKGLTGYISNGELVHLKSR